MTVHDTPVTYSGDEAARIRALATRLETPLLCPRCGSELDLGPRIRRRERTLQEASCPTCHRCVMLDR